MREHGSLLLSVAVAALAVQEYCSRAADCMEVEVIPLTCPQIHNSGGRDRC